MSEVAPLCIPPLLPPPSPLQGLDPIQLFESDPRPTFIVALRPSPSSVPHSSLTAPNSTPPSPSPSPSSPSPSPSPSPSSSPSSLSLLPSPPPSSSSSPSSPSVPVPIPIIAYTNPALNTSSALRDIILNLPAEPAHSQFWRWLINTSTTTTSLTAAEPPDQVSLSYLGLHWTRSVIAGKWIVASANVQAAVDSPSRHRDTKDVTRGMLYRHASGGSSLSLSGLSSSRDDGASQQPLLQSDTEPFLHTIHTVDWGATPLGTIVEWPARLKNTFNYVLADSSPIAIYWGPNYIAIYNEAFSKLCGPGHPHVLGKSVLDVWPEVRKHLRDLGWPPRCKPQTIEDESSFFIRYSDLGTPEETYVKWSMIPIWDGDEFLGFVQLVSETTRVHLWERRMRMLIDLGEVLVASGNVKSYWAQAIKMLGNYEPRYDIPLVLLYSVQPDPDLDPDPALYDCPQICNLEGSLGVAGGHPLAPETLRLSTSEEGLSDVLRQAISSTGPIIASTRNGTLPVSLLKDVAWRGWGDPSQSVVIHAIRPTRDDRVMGLLVLGLNPRRPYDHDYQQYISLLNQKLRSTLAATVLLEEERTRGQQAASDKKRLAEQLAIRTLQANESMERFRAVAEFVPVGMCFGDGHGNITYANEAWNRITGYEGTTPPWSLQACVVDEDQPKLVEATRQLTREGMATYELRIKPRKPMADGEGLAKANSASRYVLASSKADKLPDGTINILTCLTDVTIHKRTAEEAVRKAQEAQNVKRMAEFATVGLYDMDMNGRLLSANKVFFDILHLSKVDLAQEVVKPWPLCVVEEDLPILDRALARLATEDKVQTAEVRLKKPWVTVDSGNCVEAPCWVLVTFMTVKSPEGAVEFFAGCLSDVSLQKLQLESERKRKEEAIASKLQQDNFIDITSHEMRNPLSAMILCTEAIITCLTTVRGNSARRQALPAANAQEEEELMASIGESIENAETIMACAQHQRRIVDDILTMSKLDSKLLAVTPTTVDPVQITRDIIKMFEVEARRVDIELKLVLDPSYVTLGHDYLDFDPSRVRQVLINLLTNALKFTKGGDIRRVIVTLKASETRPTEETASVRFIPKTATAEVPCEQPALQGRGPPLFLMYQVQDSGQGLSAEETQKLFNKFVQASAKTHVKYGGSGLGLFISKRLAELQNGAIGVASLEGVGSLFAFYIEAYQPSEASVAEARAAAMENASALGIASPPPPAPRSAVATGNGDAASNTCKASESQLAKHPKDSAEVPLQRTIANIKSPQHRIGHLQGFSNQLQQQAALAEAIAEMGLSSTLIVEDNVINQKALCRGLAKLGLRVDIANHGLEALDKLTATAKSLATSDPGLPRSVPDSEGGTAASLAPIDLILMDVEMPVQGGLECTRCIRELESAGQLAVQASGTYIAGPQHVPIIALTANARSEQVEAAIQAGCDDVMIKPYLIPELIQKMRAVVMGIRENRERRANVAAAAAAAAAAAGEDGPEAQEARARQSQEPFVRGSAVGVGIGM